MSDKKLLIGVLALQGAFEEHQKCLEAVGCQTRQVRTVADLDGLDGIVLPGGESTAMGLIGTTASTSLTKNDKTSIQPILNDNNNTIENGTNNDDESQQPVTLWQALRHFSQQKPTWGTCAGMILLAERCIGTSAVIQDGQALIGGVDLTVCRNYFGSQISSFEMETPAPPLNNIDTNHDNSNNNDISSDKSPFPGVFIRAPAILTAGNDVQVLGKVTAAPCRQAAVTLEELERKIAAGENVIKLGVQDALDRSNGLKYVVVVKQPDNNNNNNNNNDTQNDNNQELKVDGPQTLTLPSSADGSTAREVICAVRKGNVLCTAFHPELTDDYRWHQYFVNMIKNK